MGDSDATTMINESLSDDALSLSSEYDVTFCNLLDTLNRIEVKKELEGKKTESLFFNMIYDMIYDMI